MIEHIRSYFFIIAVAIVLLTTAGRAQNVQAVNDNIMLKEDEAKIIDGELEKISLNEIVERSKEYNPDIICLQEIKANTDQLDLELFNKIGYNNYWFSAQKKGYSGVAILSKNKPSSVQYGTGIDHMDFEGRNLRIDFKNFSVMSLYLPSGTNLNRLEYKFKYMKEFYDYILKQFYF